MFKRALLGLSLVFAVTAQAESFHGRYFVVLFGYDGPDHKMVDSHTFATFLDGTELERGYRGAPLTISWLPYDGVVRPIGVHTGRNFSLEETLAIADSRGFSVQEFGPFEISRTVYEAARVQVRFLQSGRERYKMIAGPFGLRGLNCIHAVSNVVGPLATGFNWGIPASRVVAEHFGRVAIRYPRSFPEAFRRVRELARFAH